MLKNKLIIFLLLIGLFNLNTTDLFAASITVQGQVFPLDANPFIVAIGPAGSGECHLSWRTSFTPNINTQRLWIYGPQGAGIDTTSRDFPFQIADGGPGPDADETLIINNLVIGETYTFNLFSIAGPLMSPGVWTVPATCIPTPAVVAPVLDPLPTLCGTSKIVSWANAASPGLRCQVTASLVHLDADPTGDPANDIYSGWVDCSAGGTTSFTFNGLSTAVGSNDYYYHVQATNDPADPPTGGFSAFSNVRNINQTACGGGGGGGGSNPYCGDGTVNTANEECDDGNQILGDGCDLACKIEEEVHPAAAVCGDGVKEDPEQCDDGNTVSLDGCSDVCELEDIVTVDFILKGKPEYRSVMPSNPNLGLNAVLAFYKPSNGSFSADNVVLDNYGNGTYEAQIVTGTYDVGLNGEAHNTKVISGLEITGATQTVNLDFTIGNTWELTAGDTKDDNNVNALDIAKLISGYKATGGVNDLNKAGGVNALDIAIMIWNYREAGDVLG